MAKKVAAKKPRVKKVALKHDEVVHIVPHPEVVPVAIHHEDGIRVVPVHKEDHAKKHWWSDLFK